MPMFHEEYLAISVLYSTPCNVLLFSNKLHDSVHRIDCSFLCGILRRCLPPDFTEVPPVIVRARLEPSLTWAVYSGVWEGGAAKNWSLPPNYTSQSQVHTCLNWFGHTLIVPSNYILQPLQVLIQKPKLILKNV